jgi:serine/threonine-protein kinase
MSFIVGQNVGPYRVTEQLGQGGMATVYKAYHANLDRYVAIKVMHMAFGEDPTFLERFKREAQIVARLEHPHIVPVYDFATQEKQPYLVMKFIEGQTLKARLRKGYLSLQEIVQIMTAVASALDYAHHRDVLHRDVKPSNMILDRDGTPYLTDFGLARVASSGESTLSQDMMIGTPHYISPEQARGGVRLGPGTDIYSLGVVLYELVVGRVPFTADTPFAIVHDHIYKPLPLPTRVNPKVSPRIETVLLKALAKEPADRYKSAGEMMTAFKSAIEDADRSQVSAAYFRPEALAAAEEVSPYPVSASPAPSAQPAMPSPQPQPQPAISTPSPYGVPLQPGIPAPVAGGYYPVPGSSVSTRRKSQGGYWIVFGFALFICSCVLSMVMVADAFNSERLDSPVSAEEGTEVITPEVSNNQGDTEPDTEPPPLRVEELVERNLTVGEAQELVDVYPEDPTAWLALAITYLEVDESEEAFQALQEAGNLDVKPSPEMILMTADALAARNFTQQAMTLYLIAMGSAPENMDIRDQAGEYIYSLASSANSRNDVLDFCSLLNTNPQEVVSIVPETFNTAFVQDFLYAMLAQSIVSTANSSPTTRRTEMTVPAGCNVAELTGLRDTAADVIQVSLEDNPNLLEGRLVAGNIYKYSADNTNDPDQAADFFQNAEQIWRSLAGLPNIPEWIQRQAQSQLDVLESTD